MWKNIAEEGRQQVTIWHVCIACWLSKATNTHSQYVLLIVFPLQQWLTQRASMLRYTCAACLVGYYKFPEYVSCILYVEVAVSLTQVFEGLLIYLSFACNFLSSVVLYGHLYTKGYLCVCVFRLFHDFFYFSASGPPFPRAFVLLCLHVGVT
jgi:hypothetical protein